MTEIYRYKNSKRQFFMKKYYLHLKLDSFFLILVKRNIDPIYVMSSLQFYRDYPHIPPYKFSSFCGAPHLHFEYTVMKNRYRQ